MSNYSQNILKLVCIFCFYVLISYVFPIIRIPFSLLDIDATKNFNELAVDLSVGYLSGIFIYYLTIIKAHKDERKHRLKEIYDLFTDMSDAVFYLEKEFGKDADALDIVDYENYTDEIHNNFIKILDKYLDRTFSYKEIFNQEEKDAISEIMRMYKGIEPYNKYMDYKEKNARYKTLKEVCQIIIERRNFITLEINKNQPKSKV